MKKIIIFILSLFAITSIFAQQNRTGGLISNNDRYNRTGGILSNNDRYSSISGLGEIPYEDVVLEYANIKGSPFLHKGEIEVSFINNDDQLHEKVKILYDLYHEEIIVNPGKADQFILKQADYKGFIYNNDGKEEKYLMYPSTKIKYFQVLFENDDFKFYKDTRVKLSDDSTYIPGTSSKTKSFSQTKKYYITNRKVITKTKLRGDALVKYLPWNYRKVVPELKKELKIRKLNKESDYIKLMKAFEKKMKE